MENKQFDWSKAPEWAGAVVRSTCGRSYFVTGWGVYSPRRLEVGKSTEDYCAADTKSEGHVWELVELRPVTPAPAIKSLEDRIKERAVDRLQGRVQDAALKLRLVAGLETSDQPSGIGDMTVAQAIDAISAAIVRLRGPVVADEALERALEELADRLEPSNLLCPR